MVYNIIISLNARLDTLDAYAYYEQIENGLGDRFLYHLEKAYFKIKTHPTAFGFINEEKIIRDYLLPKFPYQVVYKIDANNIEILSVFQAQQHPNKKIK